MILLPSSKHSPNIRLPNLYPSKKKKAHISQCLAGIPIGDSHDAWKQLYKNDGGSHGGNLSHELVAGAAAFEGFKLFENHQRREGKQVSHGTAKEMLVGLAAAEAEKLIEKKGLSMHEGERAKHAAKQNAERMYDEHYGDDDQYNPNSRGAPGPLEQYGDYERRYHGRGR
ncbi:hypothetical protein L873DRAFT_954104 [Choiromyces venosus 120613-1]|uniref:CipC-like antibiotic response protein n=1 Tax=Choiromyces venosus 120613-1 TaxID=1336337 RepID=A0A3N4K3Q5_9PEZI|nr:hypothetical protein L873DRAFT_954104 [Choiromyces venosus 120613-1]